MRNLRSLALAEMVGVGLSASAGFAQAAPTVQVNAPKRAKKGLFGGYTSIAEPMRYGYRGAGISMAQQKRASRKAKNVRRHRAASRN